MEIVMCYSLMLCNIICTCMFVRFSQFQNYHTNMKRLDITLTKFIKLHDCIPVNFRFAVYTQNFLSLNGMSWYKLIKLTFILKILFVLILCSFSSLLVSEARYFRIMVVFSLSISTLFCFKKLSLSPN